MRADEVPESVIALRLMNFMGFEDTGWMELRPVTLLFGRNSAGKSALIRAILLLRQSLKRRDADEPLLFSAENGVDLGSFVRMIRGREVCDLNPEDISKPGELRQLLFALRCSVQRHVVADLLDRGSRWDAFMREPGDTWVDLSLSFQWNTELRRCELSAVTLEAPFSADTFEATRNVIFQAELIEKRWYLSSHFEEVPLLPAAKEKAYTTLWSIKTGDGLLPSIISPSTVPDKFFRKIDAIYSSCTESVTDFLEGVHYLGPFRYEARRIYPACELSQDGLQTRGQAAIKDYLLSPHSNDAKDRLDSWMEKLGFGDQLQSEGLFVDKTKAAEAYQISFYEGGTIPSINLKDVGYGASQVLPVILQSFFAPKDSTVIIEQPELHLHPAAQAELADLFVELAGNAMGASGMGRSPRFLIETHSEMFLLPTRVRLARTSQGCEQKYLLSEGDFVCYFVHRDRRTGISKVEQITFDTKGRYVTLPVGFEEFFGQDFDELRALDKARLPANAELADDDSGS